MSPLMGLMTLNKPDPAETGLFGVLQPNIFELAFRAEPIMLIG
jgi:hypothetical protein